MSGTIRERDMLKTWVPERDMSVTTFLHEHRRDPPCHPWTAVWFGEHVQLCWLHFWQGAVTPGGLAEAHESIAARVQAGELPALDEERPRHGLERLRARREAQPDEQLAHATE